KNGSIRFPGEGGQLKSMLLNVAYDNGEGKTKTNSYLRANLRNSSFHGNKLQGDLRMENLDKPVVDAELKGSLPASLLNFFTDSAVYNFKEGIFDIDHYKITGLDVKSFSTKTFIAKSIAKLKTEDVKFSYHKDQIEIIGGNIDLDEAGKMKVDVDELIWNKAKGEDVDGELIFAGDNVDFQLKGNHSQGEVDAKGSVTGLGKNPVLSAEWIVKGIEMQDLLAAFSNFDQTFITNENLKGKADVWSVTTIPYDVNGNIQMNGIVVRAAIDIKDGQLKDMKILEDFSKYIHLDDLRDIRFNQFRNYLKIEQGKVSMPVVFIQSSALNLSVNGVHSFNQEILYNMKMNAGQAAANKLKKVDVVKRFKQARKSGWINLYYVLSGTTSDVKYEQDQKQVITAFEQSSQMKEALRNYLVDKFGHDVYWLEPNEWEDIPEYK
ncbi:MAG: AsmA-like C-terminal region-containing protein, partial [Saprospiraceae bacterium]